MLLLEKAILFITLFAIAFPLGATIGPIKIALYNIPLILLLFLWMFRVPTNRIISKANSWDLILFLFMFWILLSSYISGSDNFEKAFLFATSSFLAIYSRHNFSITFDYKFILVFSITLVSLQIFVCLLQYATNSNIGAICLYFGQKGDFNPLMLSGIMQRAVGTVGLPNLVCLWLIMLVPFLYMNYSKRSSDVINKLRWRSVSLILMMLSLAIVIMNNSRANFFALILSMMYLFFITSPKHKYSSIYSTKCGYIFVSLLLLSLCVFVSLGWHYYSEFILNFADFYFEHWNVVGYSFAVRLEQYKAALITIAHNPLYGIGWEEGKYSWDFYEFSVPADLQLRPHNIYLTIATESGLPALICLFFLVLKPLVMYLSKNVSKNIWTDAMFISLASFLFVSLFYIVPLHLGIWPFFMFSLGTFYTMVYSMKKHMK